MQNKKTDILKQLVFDKIKLIDEKTTLVLTLEENLFFVVAAVPDASRIINFREKQFDRYLENVKDPAYDKVTEEHRVDYKDEDEDFQIELYHFSAEMLIKYANELNKNVDDYLDIEVLGERGAVRKIYDELDNFQKSEEYYEYEYEYNYYYDVEEKNEDLRKRKENLEEKSKEIEFLEKSFEKDFEKVNERIRKIDELIEKGRAS